MFRNIFTLIIGIFVCCNSFAEEHSTPINHSAIVKKANEMIDKKIFGNENRRFAYIQMFDAMDSVFEEIIDEAEFEANVYHRNHLKSKFENELGCKDIAYLGSIERASRTDEFPVVIKFTIKLYDSYIKNGYTQIDALREMQKVYLKITAAQHSIRGNKQAEAYKKEQAKKNKPKRRRKVPSSWRTYR